MKTLRRFTIRWLSLNWFSKSPPGTKSPADRAKTPMTKSGIRFCFLAMLIMLSGVLSAYHFGNSGTLQIAGPTRKTHSQQAIAVLKSTQWDFGVVQQGEILRTSFFIQNVGDRRLIVQQRSSSCDCASTPSQTMIVQPGKSANIAATVDTHGIEGAFQMELEFTTSDPQLPEFTLSLLSEVRCQR